MPGGPTVWWDRGYQPHVESPDLIQHVCYRLADSLPRAVVEAMDAELKQLPPALRDPEKEKRVNAYLDAGKGSCILRVPEIAQLVQETFLHFHGQRCTVYEWCVMPNHVHVLFQAKEGWTMSKIVSSWKSYTGRRISAYRKSAGLEPCGPAGGSVWHREYWDRYIRDAAHYRTVVDYIRMNPVKAGLCATPEDWRWSSAYYAMQERGGTEHRAGQEPGGPDSTGGKPGGPEVDQPRSATPQRGAQHLAGQEPGGPL